MSIRRRTGLTPRWVAGWLCLLWLALAAASAHAQALSTEALAGTWAFFQLAPLGGPANASTVRSYSGQVTFGVDGSAVGGTLTDDQSTSLTVTSGGLAVTAGGHVSGSLGFNGLPQDDFNVSDARLLASRHAIVGTASFFDQAGLVGRVGLFNLVKLEPGQSFTINGALAGAWAYHELNPVDQSLPSGAGTASWSRGLITFHTDDITPGQSCAEASLVRSDGSVRATSSGSFGCAVLDAAAAGAVSGTNASFNAQMQTSSTLGERDLILGLTDGTDTQFPGMVALSKIAGGVTFGPSDLAGSWSVYLQRTDAGPFADSTVQYGQLTFSATGVFAGGSLVEPFAGTTVLIPAPASTVAVASNGSVTATLVASSPSILPTHYLVRGVVRATKDVVTGVVTVQGPTAANFGLVTLVRDVTLFDLAQPAYAVTEGNGVKVTVLRSGNMAGPAGVTWTATGSPGLLTGATTGVLTFPANTASRTFTVTTAPNTVVDGNRSVTLTLGNPTGASAVLGTTTSAPLTIIDDDRAGTFKLSAPSYTVAENGRSVPVTIQRVTGSGSASGVVVTFALTDGTALAGRDYTVPANTSVTFGATDTVKVVPVPILENALVDGPRTFTFTLTNVSANGVLAPAPTSATVTITDNDVGGSVQFSAAAYPVNEPLTGNTSTLVTVTRTGGAAGGVLVDFATADGTARAGSQYLAASGTLTFDSTNTSKTFAIPILADGVITGDTTVLLALGSVRSSTGFTGAGAPTLGALARAVLTIKDAQKGVQFASANYSVKETVGTAMVSVARTGPTADTATVRYSTATAAGSDAAIAGTNYTPVSGVLTFGPGVSSQSFAVKILPDKVVRGPRTVLLLLSGANSSVTPPAALGQRSTAVLTILNTDTGGTVSLGSTSFGGTEGGAAVVTVLRTGGTGTISVNYATSDQPCAIPPCPGLAQADLDYNPSVGTLTFAPGETSKSILIPLLTDSLVEGPETFLITLGNIQGGATLGTPSQAVVTITDKNQGGVIQLGAAAVSVTAPASGNVSAPVMLSRTGTNLGRASVLVMTGVGTAIPGVHYLPIATTIVFGDGEMSKLVPILVLPDATVTGNLTVPILLSSPDGGATLGTTRSGVLTIVDAEPSVGFSAPAYAVTEGGTATITVLRGGPPAGMVTVPFLASGGTATAPRDYASKQGTLTFAAGVARQTFTVTTVKRLGDNLNRSVALTLGTPSPSTVALLGGPATLTITDNDGPGTFQFQAPAYSVTEGGAATTVTVTRTGGVGGTVSVPWISNGSASDFTPTSGTLTFSQGQTTRTLAVTAVNNTLLDGNRSFTLTLGTPSPPTATLGDQATAALTVIDNDSGGTIQFAAAAQSVAENVAGGVLNVGVSRSGANLAGGILVDYAITGDTDAITSDSSGTLTFGPAATTVPLPLAIVNDPSPQADRSLTIALSNPRSSNLVTGPRAPVLGATASTTVTITDSLPRVRFSAPSFSIVEGDTATIGVTRAGPTTGTVTVHYATVAGGTAVSGTDYTPASGTLTLTGGGAKTFTVPTFDDGVLAGSRTVVLSLDSAGGGSIGTPATATLTIQDRQSAGTVQFASATASVLEGGVVRVTVTRTGTNLAGGVTVGWSATGGTATPVDDFTPVSGTLSFGSGVTSQSVDITAVDDGIPEGTETIVLSLDPPAGGAALGSPSQMTVLIIDRQQTVAFAGAAVNVGETTPSATLQILRAGVPSDSVSVQVRTVDGTAVAGLDYGARNDVVTFQPGEVAKTYTVPILTQNAATRNGNRTLTVVLGNTSGELSLGMPATATVTIMDFRPDLVITSVSAPSGALTGKSISTPSTVRNIGPVAAPPFRVGLYLVRSDDPGALAPGAGSLVTVQPVAGLAAGATAAFPTQITLDDNFPSGDYYLSAVANFDLAVTESDTTNDGLSSAPAKLTIDRSLIKFKSASATFSQSTPAPATAPGRAAPAAGACDLSGSVDLSGTFAITSQTRNIASGQANLTGTLGGFPVQYLISFTAQLDRDPTADSVTGTLDSVVFNVLGTSITGTGNGSFVGSLANGFNADVAGQFTTSTGGACVFTGSLDAEGQTSFQLRYATSAVAGSFGFDGNPAVQFPVRPPDYAAVFKVFIDEDFPDPSQVLFSGPPGSGLNRTPADPATSAPDPNRRRFTYVAPPRSGVAPGGTYSVVYKDTTQTFTLAPYNANASFVVIYPTVTIDENFQMARIDWVYRDAVTGANLSAAPSYMTGLTVRIQTQEDSLTQPQSPNLSPSVTSFDFTCGALCSAPTWSQVQSISFQYTDVVGNQYEVVYPKGFEIQLGPRLTNTYSAANCAVDATSCSRAQRLFTFFIDVPVDSVPTFSCDVQRMVTLTGPFYVSIQNQTEAGRPPDGDLTCVDRLGTTTLPDRPVTVDVFGARVDLEVPPNVVPYPPGLEPMQFLFRINPTGLPEHIYVPSVDPIEPNPATDKVTIPNPATQDLKPSGFTLADAKLGQPQSISWVPPPFVVVRDLFLEAVVHATVNGDGLFCTVQDKRTQLDPAATQAAFTLPATCQGQSVLSASVCVVYVSDDQLQRSEACWQWR